jgi:uncharacterized repeat protein (TIGR01451 family)
VPIVPMTSKKTRYYFLVLVGALMVAAGVLVAAPQGQAQAPPRDCLTIGGGQFCLEKTVSPDPATVGAPITFTVRELNLSTITTGFGVTPLVDTLPPGLRDVSVTQAVSTGGTAPNPCTVSGNTVTCPPPRVLPPGGEFTLTIVATPTRPGNFVNTATDPGFLEVEAPFTVVAAPPAQDQQPQGGGGSPAPITQEGEQDSESGEVDQDFDVS